MKHGGRGAHLAGLATTAFLLSGCSAPAADPGRPVPPGAAVAVVGTFAPADDPFSLFACGGVLVEPRTVLTAAHCLTGRSAQTVDVVIGAPDLCATPTAAHRYRVTQVQVRPLDVAALQLAQPAAVAPLEPAVAATPGMTGWVAGWGSGDRTRPPRCRQSTVPLDILPVSACRAALNLAKRGQGSEGQLCARPEPGAVRNTCRGDSGSPLLVTGPSGRVLVAGITSWGPGCRLTDVGVYSRVGGDGSAATASPRAPSHG